MPQRTYNTRSLIEKREPPKKNRSCSTCFYEETYDKMKQGRYCKRSRVPKDDYDGNCVGWKKKVNLLESNL